MVALRTLAQFDLASQGATVAECAAQREQARRDRDQCARQCEASAESLRDIASRASLNPILLAAARDVFRSDRRQLEHAQQVLAEAEQREVAAREELADIRNRERSLDKVLGSERRRTQLALTVKEMSLIDDLWLQQTGSTRA